MKRQPIDRAIRNTWARSNDRATGECPDDSLIAAYLESRLQSDECARFEAHAAVCTSCREILALSLRLSDEPEFPEAAPSDRHGKLIFHFAIPVSVVALILVASFAGLLYYRGIREVAKESETIATAELNAPPKKAKTEVPPASIPTPASPSRQLADGRETGRLEEARGRISAESPAKPAQTLHELQVPDKARDSAQADEFNARAPLPLEADASKSKSEVSKEIASPPSPAVVGVVGGVSAPVNLAQETEPSARRAGAVETAAVESKDVQYQKTVSSGASKGAKAAIERSDRKKDLADQPPPTDETTVGGRTFTRVAGVWVDAECRKHPSAQQLQLKRDSSGFDEIKKGIPGIEDLVTDTVRVQVFWKGRIYLIGP